MGERSRRWVQGPRFACALLLGVALPVAPVAAANDDLPRAQRLFREGTALAEQGDMRGAIARFESSYAAAPLPPLLFNIAELYRQLGETGDREDRHRAIDYYEQYLAAYHAQHGVDSPDSRTVARRIAELQDALAPTGSSAPSTPPPLAPKVEPSPPAAVPPPIAPPPPIAALVAPAAPPEIVPARPARRIAGGALVGGGLAIAIAGAITWGVGAGFGPTNLQGFHDGIGAANAESAAGGTIVAVGVVAAVAGVVLLALPASAREKVTALARGVRF